MDDYCPFDSLNELNDSDTALYYEAQRVMALLGMISVSRRQETVPKADTYELTTSKEPIITEVTRYNLYKNIRYYKHYRQEDKWREVVTFHNHKGEVIYSLEVNTRDALKPDTLYSWIDSVVTYDDKPLHFTTSIMQFKGSSCFVGFADSGDLVYLWPYEEKFSGFYATLPCQEDRVYHAENCLLHTSLAFIDWKLFENKIMRQHRGLIKSPFT